MRKKRKGTRKRSRAYRTRRDRKKNVGSRKVNWNEEWEERTPAHTRNTNKWCKKCTRKRKCYIGKNAYVMACTNREEEGDESKPRTRKHKVRRKRAPKKTSKSRSKKKGRMYKDTQKVSRKVRHTDKKRGKKST